MGTGIAASDSSSVAGQAGTGPTIAALPSYDPACYFCPGNSRAGGERQSANTLGTFMFDDDFRLCIRTVEVDIGEGGLISCRRYGTRRLSGGLFFASARLNDRADEGRGNSAGRGGVGHAVPRTGGDSLGRSCADLRKSRRHDGRQQPSSPLPDLGECSLAQCSLRRN